MPRRKLRLLLASLIISIMSGALLTGCDNNTKNDAPQNVSSPSNTKSDTPDDKIEENTNTFISIGDYVEFGKYEQDNNTSNGLEPIKWQVLDIHDGKALLTSCYILDNIQYCEYAGLNGDDSIESLPWSASNIFYWLHKDFAMTAFSEDEQMLITSATNHSSEDAETIGSVFLLSYDEIQKYYDIDTIKVKIGSDTEYTCVYSHELLCEPTPYAIENSIDCKELTQESIDNLAKKGFNCTSYVAGGKYSGYWLRTSFNFDSWFTAHGHALFVEHNGTIKTDSANFENIKTKDHGIRPCIWINLEGAEEYLTKASNSKEPWMSDAQKGGTSNIPVGKNEKEEASEIKEFDWEVKENTLYIRGNCAMEDWYPESKGTKPPWYEEKNISKVIIEEGIENIGTYAFYQCENLIEIEIAQSVTSIGRNAFAECNSLENIYIPDTVNSIGYRMFENCKNLKSVRLPNKAEIASGVFEGCVSLQSINLPENMSVIGSYMFKGCESLTNIVIPNGVTIIEDFAFSQCKSLTNIEIPDTVTYIGEYAFVGCPAITE